MNTNEKFATFLRDMRLEAGLTLHDAVKEIPSISISQLDAYECGVTPVVAEDFFALVQVYEPSAELIESFMIELLGYPFIEERL